jgi:hypothetical protein
MLVPQLCSSTIPEEAGNQERLYGPPPSFKNVDWACVSPARACSLPYVSFGVFCLSPSVLMQLFWTSDFCSVFIFFSFASCKRLQLIVSIIKMHMEVVYDIFSITITRAVHRGSLIGETKPLDAQAR